MPGSPRLRKKGRIKHAVQKKRAKISKESRLVDNNSALYGAPFWCYPSKESCFKAATLWELFQGYLLEWGCFCAMFDRNSSKWALICMSSFNQNTDNFMHTLGHHQILSGNEYILTERYRIGSYMSMRILTVFSLFLVDFLWHSAISMYVGLVTALWS